MTSSNLPELYAALTMYQQRDVPGDATEAAASVDCSNDDMLATPQTMANKCDSQSSKTIKLVDTKEYEASVPLDVKHESNIIAEDDVVSEESERKAPTKAAAMVDIVRRLEEVLREKSPCQEDDLMRALSLSQAQLIIEEYGTLTAFTERHPAFRVVREDLLSFVYYKDHGNEDACHSTSHLQQGATTIPSASYNDGARQHAEGYDDGPRRARVSSSNSSAYESAVEEADGEQEGSTKHGWSQVSSPPALQAEQETCATEAQNQGWDPAVFIEKQSTLEKPEAEVAELKGRMETLRESDDSEEQEPRVKIDELLKTPLTEQTQKAEEVKNPTAKKDKPTGTNGENDQVSPRHPLPLPGPEDKARSVPVDPSPRPQPPSDKELSRHATPSPVPDYSERPGCEEEVAASCSDVKSMRPSQEDVPTKSKVAEQISKIVRMVKKREPSCTDDEIRKLFDQVRQSHGGFSRMTFKAIVELLLDNMKAVCQQQN